MNIKKMSKYQQHSSVVIKTHHKAWCTVLSPMEIRQVILSFILDFLLTVTTIIKSVIGSGILGLPYTVSQCGWVFAVIVFSMATVLTQFGSILLLRAKNLSGHSNFSTIFYHIYQNKFCKGLGSVLIFLNNLGVCKNIQYFRYT